jgi:hypothetical protein
VRHAVDLQVVRDLKRAAGATVNDVCLALAAGALRAVALSRGEEPSRAQGDGAGERALGRRSRRARQPHLVRVR